MASPSEDVCSVQEMWELKMKTGYKCINELITLMDIQGVEKLAREIQKDIDFLDQMSPKDILLVKSSNINRFDALVRCVKKQKGLCAVLQPYKMRENGGTLKSVIVDIVCHINFEEVWVKVIAKNRNSLTSASMGDCAFGRRNIIDQAKEFVDLSLQNKYNYKAPKIIFHFDSGVDSCIAHVITKLGINVTGKVEYSSNDSSVEDLNCHTQSIPGSIGVTALNSKDNRPRVMQKLNLDVCAMIGYVSELTNGGSNLVCNNRVINLQAQAEQVRPLVPILDEIFEGRELLCCCAALEAFKTIVETLGGPNEKKRSDELIKRLTIVGDTDRPIAIKLSKRITKRSALVFMTGEDHEAITITANKGLVQGAASQGQKFAAFNHEARSLTEKISASMGKQ